MLALRPIAVPPPYYPSSLAAPSVHHQHPLAQLSSLDQQLFYEYGVGPKRSVKFPLVHRSFEHHALTQPNAIAVEHLSYKESITYAQLDIRANRLARRLRERAGIVPGKRVCILARRSISLVVSILAVLKAGGQYVPLDAVTIKDETLHFVLQDASPSVVLVMNEYAHRVPSSVQSMNVEDAIQADIDSHSPGTKIDEAGLTEKDGCYCIYTSGTTGRPKGVDVRHQGVSNVISAPPGNVHMAPSLRVAQLLNIAFDMGAWEVLGSLYNGCTLCIRGNHKKDWISLLKTVHIVIATPTVLTQHDPNEYPLLREVIVGGEPCPQALADKWASARPGPGGLRFHNCCGPTEISICNTVQHHSQIGYPLSIGKPLPNTNVYILTQSSPDDDPTPVPIGSVGSMWVGGIGVSGGYLNLPEKTGERYRVDPFVGGMMFNTGDLGRWRVDGQLDHMGRADDQVKVKGFRVELDGIGSSMRTYEPVKSAVALLIDSQLYGFVTPSNIDLTLLREQVAKSQPYYAVPNHFIALDDFPTTSNGKVDKRLLRAMALEQQSTITLLPKEDNTVMNTATWTPPATPAEPSPVLSSTTSTPTTPSSFSLTLPSSSSSSCPSPKRPTTPSTPSKLRHSYSSTTTTTATCTVSGFEDALRRTTKKNKAGAVVKVDLVEVVL